ncbi:hypothetical protein G5C65_11030 [Streptomyces sp. SB3404]|uniref:Translation initiation factor IF-2 n=1 Tax=Streptomyces boncukensis TaxID=2711219 RepID=A0A6G4WUT7_9ACTN|nr:hypothetical protein [Streptomyces boncukensis]
MTGESGADWIRVPVGEDAGRWTTRSRCRRVLAVVHNVTAATRLLDVLPLFHDDPRVQLLATCTGSSPFQSGVPELLAEAGLPVLPWRQALATPVDLALAASYGGQLERLRGKLAVLSHGIGYNKKLATPDTGHRTPDTGRPVPVPTFGLAPEWLLHEGRPVADATVLSHPEQLDRLRAVCPQAAPTAVLAGDPCFDRLLAAGPERDRFRRALGVAPGQRLVLLTSTWNPHSLFGDAGDDTLPALLPRLATELPADEYRVAAVLHPNIWHGHGPGQIHAWLARARRAGLALADPLQEWRQALLAADVVLGDHGSVTYYAAALGTPTLLAAAPLDGLDPASPVAEFVRAAPRLRPYEPLRRQLDRAVSCHDPARAARARERTSSAPGQAAALLRRTAYRLLGLEEPAAPARLAPLPLPPYAPPRRTVPLRVLTRLLGGAPPEVSVVRYADPAYEPEGGPGQGPDAADAAHTAVAEDGWEPEARTWADVLLRRADPDDPRLGPPAVWTAQMLARYPSCALAASVTGPDRCVVRPRSGPLVRLRAAPGPDGWPDPCDPAVYASALHAWLSEGKTLAELRGGLTVRTGASVHRVHVTEE